MEITLKKADGVGIIKNTLESSEGTKGDATSTITYLGSPRYRMVVKAENFKIAEKHMNNIIEKTRANIEKQHGIFNFVHQDSKKSHDLQQV